VPVLRYAKLLGLIIAVAACAAYGVSFYWPIYRWDLVLESPGGGCDLVVLRRDASAFADLSYRIYLLPHEMTPADMKKGSQVWYTPMWRGHEHLVYASFDYPKFRWTSPKTLEIDVNEAYPEDIFLEPIKRFESGDTILISLVFGKNDVGNTRP
jgi:hypothetical protein